LKDALVLSHKIINSEQKTITQEEIKKKIDLVLERIVNEKIKIGNRLKIENIRKSINLFQKALNYVNEIYNKENKKDLRKIVNLKISAIIGLKKEVE